VSKGSSNHNLDFIYFPTAKQKRIRPKSHEIYSTSNYDNEIEETFDHMLVWNVLNNKEKFEKTVLIREHEKILIGPSSQSTDFFNLQRIAKSSQKDENIWILNDGTGKLITHQMSHS
jgi:hypothetical protein